MKKKVPNSIKTIFILVPVIIATNSIIILPWWSFVIPVLVVGVVITKKEWKVACFPIGFLAGFLVWASANWFFDIKYSGIFLDRFGFGIKLLLLLVSGIVGGLLTGLSLYTGRSLAFDKKAEIKL
jgi:hypothetical protein